MIDWTHLVYLAPLLLAMAALHRRRHRDHTNNGALLEEATSTGGAPPSLHPVIDHARCIGCEACVHACPEFPSHRVLGVVRGKAHLISPSDCIGHGACRAACPVDAIRLVFGTAERGVDIPEVDPRFESNVPGIYIAGELGGMGLIRNAIEQGRQAMENVLQALGSRGSGDAPLDVVVVGAGPAGLAATLKAQEAGVRYVTIEQDAVGGTVANFPRGKLVMTGPAELPLIGKTFFRETDKETLMRFWTAAVRKTGIKIRSQERVDSVRRTNDGFEVHTDKGVHRTRSVLLALGRRGTPRRLEVPGEDLPKVAYRLDDPAQYAGKQILVVGGGDSALEAALAVAEHAARVVLSHRSGSFNRAKAKNRQRLEAALRADEIEVLLESTVEEITPSEVVVRTERKTFRLPNEAVLICVGGVLPTRLLTETGINVETKCGTA